MHVLAPPTATAPTKSSLLALNPAETELWVLDAAARNVVRRLALGRKPYGAAGRSVWFGGLKANTGRGSAISLRLVGGDVHPAGRRCGTSHHHHEHSFDTTLFPNPSLAIANIAFMNTNRSELIAAFGLSLRKTVLLLLVACVIPEQLACIRNHHGRVLLL